MTVVFPEPSVCWGLARLAAGMIPDNCLFSMILTGDRIGSGDPLKDRTACGRKAAFATHGCSGRAAMAQSVGMAFGNSSVSTARFREVVQPHLRAAHALARSLTHSGDDSQDIVQ